MEDQRIVALLQSKLQKEPKSLFKKMTCHKVTNPSNRRLISEDRSTKATLLFTIPC